MYFKYNIICIKKGSWSFIISDVLWNRSEAVS